METRDNKVEDRGRFFLDLFEQGKRFTDELLSENAQLRKRLAVLEHGLQGGAEPDIEMTSELLVELDQTSRERDTLREESVSLREKLERIQEEHDALNRRHAQIEQQNANFAALYVASYQLHSTLDTAKVLEFVKEIVINLVGSENFCVYLHDDKKNAFVLSAEQGTGQRLGSLVPLGDNLLSEIARASKVYVAPAETFKDPAQPLAIVPLNASDKVVGVLQINTLLMQKEQLEPIDMEMFDLLAGHAATALMAAQLYGRSQRKASTLEGIFQLMKEDGGTPSS